MIFIPDSPDLVKAAREQTCLLKELVHFLNGILDFVLVFEVLRALTTLRFQGKEKRGGD